MIVDINTRIWASPEELGEPMAAQLRRRRVEPWNRPHASIQDHAEAMQPVSRCAILGLEAQQLDALIDIDTIAEHVARDPEKHLGFAGIDPTTGRCMKRLNEAMEAGLVGVTMSPAAAGFHPADTDAMELFEACEHEALPVIIEATASVARGAKMEFAPPLLLDEVARTFPDLKLVLTSLGDAWIDQGLALVSKHPTVYADLSGLINRPWQLYHALLTAHQRGVMNQIVFGSGFPFNEPEAVIVTLYSVNQITQGTQFPGVPREQLRSVVERDTLKCLGLEHLRTPPPPEVSPPLPEAASESKASSAETVEASEPKKKRRFKREPVTAEETS